MKKAIKLLWRAIFLITFSVLLVMTFSCAGTTQSLNSTPTLTKTDTITQTDIITKTATITKTDILTASAPSFGLVEKKPELPVASSSAASSPGAASTNKTLGLTLRIPADGDNPAVEQGGIIPKDYTCEGTSSSPPLEWSGEPPETAGFAFIVWHKPDASDLANLPKGVPHPCKWYWIIYNIPKDVHSLPKNVGTKVGILGLNEHNARGYEPFCSTGPGDKEYYYTIYALVEQPTLAVPVEKVARDDLLTAIKDSTLASYTLCLHNIRGLNSAGPGGAAPPPGRGGTGAPSGTRPAPSLR